MHRVASPVLLLPSRFFWLLVMLGGLAACRDDDMRGVLVAKYLDGSARFVKHIDISTIDGPALSVALVTNTKRCELIGPIPVGAFSAISDCKEVSGLASLRCEGTGEVLTRWQMTSCHSGFGRSFQGVEPVFLYGFSGNTYSAQNQLELATDAQFALLATDCQANSMRNSPGECHPPITELLLKFPEPSKHEGFQ